MVVRSSLPVTTLPRGWGKTAPGGYDAEARGIGHPKKSGRAGVLDPELALARCSRSATRIGLLLALRAE